MCLYARMLQNLIASFPTEYMPPVFNISRDRSRKTWTQSLFTESVTSFWLSQSSLALETSQPYNEPKILVLL